MSDRILIVEDEPNIVESLRFILERADYDVHSISDGRAALERLREQPYSVVVLDIMLPGMNGLDVLRAVRQDDKLAHLPVIVLTAKGQAQDRRAAAKVGANSFITKPYSNAEVVKRVGEFAGR
ncbi:response regulator transcription factor [Chelativorans salis]|uniref:Response regulator n=1 Tax=Chelativorans salis TaxID=2978478 RepID=A0ABT2LMI9_9HYPH|nr:response regulator [Chelativorans sp. EGI FJ00035]MCT7374613.1 response regulator [Chelativorans sp. EGI FJ00035]